MLSYTSAWDQRQWRWWRLLQLHMRRLAERRVVGTSVAARMSSSLGVEKRAPMC